MVIENAFTVGKKDLDFSKKSKLHEELVQLNGSYIRLHLAATKRFHEMAVDIFRKNRNCIKN